MYTTAAHQRADNARKRLAIQALKAAPCADCGGTFPPECMDYDHRDPSAKMLLISKVGHHGLGALLAEASKCDVVCANCHRIRTQRTKRDGKTRTSAVLCDGCRNEAKYRN